MKWELIFNKNKCRNQICLLKLLQVKSDIGKVRYKNLLHNYLRNKLKELYLWQIKPSEQIPPFRNLIPKTHFLIPQFPYYFQC